MREILSAAAVLLVCTSVLRGAENEPARAPARLVAATSGTKGRTEGTRYLLQDTRTVFFPDEDRQVVVLFEWEGRPGLQRCVLRWKNPAGEVVSESPFEYRAVAPRFSIYGSMLLAETDPLGRWTAEMDIGGVLCGTHAFELKQGKRSADVKPMARPLSQAEIYERARAAVVTVEALDAAGARLWRGMGFGWREGEVLTAFQAVEGASRLRLVRAGSAPVETDELVAYHRRQDWAVVRAPGLDVARLPLMREATGGVGDRCFALDVGREGGTTLVEGRISGVNDHAKAGPRLSISLFVDRGGIGGPLLDDYGSAIAVMGGAMVPGAGALAHRRGWHDQTALISAAAVPLTAVREPADARPMRLGDLVARGDVVALLPQDRDQVDGFFGRTVIKSAGGRIPTDPAREFHAGDGEISLVATWLPRARRKGTAQFRLYDLDNRLLAEAPAIKVSLKPHERTELVWRIPIAGLEPGVYRVDLIADAEPIWRSGFRIVD